MILQFHIKKVVQMVMPMLFLANQPTLRNSVQLPYIYQRWYQTFTNIKVMIQLPLNLLMTCNLGHSHEDVSGIINLYDTNKFGHNYFWKMA